MDYFQVGKSNSLAIIYFFGQSYQKIEKICPNFESVAKVVAQKIQNRIENSKQLHPAFTSECLNK